MTDLEPRRPLADNPVVVEAALAADEREGWWSPTDGLRPMASRTSSAKCAEFLPCSGLPKPRQEARHDG